MKEADKSHLDTEQEYISLAMFLIGYIGVRSNIQKNPTNMDEVIFIANKIKSTAEKVKSGTLK